MSTTFETQKDLILDAIAGLSTQEALDFLEDGAALAALGITDEDEVEETHFFLSLDKAQGL